MWRMRKSAASDGEERCHVGSHMIGGSRHRRGQRKLVGMKQVPLQTCYSHSCSIRGCEGFFFFFFLFVWYSLSILSGIGQLFHHFLDKELKSQDEDIYQVGGKQTFASTNFGKSATVSKICHCIVFCYNGCIPVGSKCIRTFVCLDLGEHLKQSK